METMKPEFHDNYQSRHVDPPEPTHENPGQRKEMAQILGACFRWVLDFDQNNQYNRQHTEIIGRRLIALAWVTNPALFDGASLAAVCKRFKVRPSLAKLTGEAFRRFGVVNRGEAENGKGSISHALPGRRDPETDL
jgi:hypothetical protein